MKALEFVKAHWRVFAAALLLMLAFAWGRYSVPTHVVTQTVTQTVYKDRVVEKQVKAEERVKVVYRDRTVVQHADGTVEHRDVEKTETEHDTQTATEHETSHESDKTVATVKVSDAPKAQWHVGVLAAGNPLHPTPELLGPVALGVLVERRIAGPVWLSAFVLSSGTVGVGATLEF